MRCLCVLVAALSLSAASRVPSPVRGSSPPAAGGPSNGCTIKVNGDLGDPKEYQPVYLRGDHYLAPEGRTGLIRLKAGEQITLACPGKNNCVSYRKGVPNGGTKLNGEPQTVTATCVQGTSMSLANVHSTIKFRDLVCYSAVEPSTVAGPNNKCYKNHPLIQVGYTVNQRLHPLYESCFDENRREVLYVKYSQTPADAVHQGEVPRPPRWSAGTWYPGFSAENMYKPETQKKLITKIVGANASQYINVPNGKYFTRGHLAAKSDFVFATGQRLSFWFINAAPQWEPFNNRNWNVLEERLREHIAAVGYSTVIYTGTWGVTQLKDASGVGHEMYLREDRQGNKQIPVPLYYYKVVYDEKKKLGIAFVGINNPWVTEKEAKSLTFCKDQCRNNTDFNWLSVSREGMGTWEPDNIDYGYSFCCKVQEFRNTVPYLPNFEVNGLLI